MTISKEHIPAGWVSAVRTAIAMQNKNMAISANLVLDMQKMRARQAARIADLEEALRRSLDAEDTPEGYIAREQCREILAGAGEGSQFSQGWNAHSDAVMQMAAGRGDDVAHVFPDDLEKLRTSECSVTAYSVPMGDPDRGQTVPLCLHPAPTQQPETTHKLAPDAGILDRARHDPVIRSCVEIYNRGHADWPTCLRSAVLALSFSVAELQSQLTKRVMDAKPDTPKAPSVHPAITALGAWQQYKLEKNKHKDGEGWARNPDGSRNGWAGCSQKFLAGKLDEEVSELLLAIHQAQSAEVVHSEAADVANIAMMFAEPAAQAVAAPKFVDLSIAGNSTEKT